MAARQLEAAVNEADKTDLVDTERLREAVGGRPGVSGAGKLSRVLDGRTFAPTDSELERRFLRLARRAGLGKPMTGALVAGHRTPRAPLD